MKLLTLTLTKYKTKDLENKIQSILIGASLNSDFIYSMKKEKDKIEIYSGNYKSISIYTLHKYIVYSETIGMELRTRELGYGYDDDIEFETKGALIDFLIEVL